jgi:hypothetical protein
MSLRGAGEWKTKRPADYADRELKFNTDFCTKIVSAPCSLKYILTHPSNFAIF